MGLWNKLWNRDRDASKIIEVENPAGKVEVISAPGPKRKYKGTVYLWPSASRGQFIKRAVEQGRNQPCSCGSGKKYKRCCLIKKTAPEREMVIAAGLKTEGGK